MLAYSYQENKSTLLANFHVLNELLNKFLPTRQYCEKGGFSLLPIYSSFTRLHNRLLFFLSKLLSTWKPSFWLRFSLRKDKKRVSFLVCFFAFKCRYLPDFLKRTSKSEYVILWLKLLAKDMGVPEIAKNLAEIYDWKWALQLMPSPSDDTKFVLSTYTYSNF